MELQKLIQRLHHEKSRIGNVSRVIEKQRMYNTYKDESRLKHYLSKRMKKKGLLSDFVELLTIQELINSQNEQELA